MRWIMRALAGCSVLTVALTLLAVPAAAQVNATGQWSLLSQTMPINPIHVGLMRTGKILVVSGSQNDPTVTTYSAAVYDPNTGAISVQTIPWDLFCNGLSFMPDGRALIAGGNLQYNPFRGIRTATVFDPATEKFAQIQDMARGRWYPSVVGLPDGRMATFSGWLEGGGTNNAVEIYTNPNGWSPENFAPFVPPLYPWLHLLPDGRVFQSGASIASQIFNPSTGQWQTNVATMNYPRDRTYGSSVLLPLSAADNWRPRIMVMGGDNPATATAEIIDLSQANPRWQTTNSMSAPRIQMDAVILPTGKVLALGGSAQNNTASTASLNADLFDPATGTWSPAGTMNLPRMYHSVALLLPDGTVWSAGSNPNQGSYEQRMEIYRPGYLFNASGGAAARPSITGAPGAVGYGGSFAVTTPNAANIASVALIRNGANTHAFDMDQRMVSLAFTRGSGSLTVTAPPNANIAPPGYYMLFIVDNNGVPSVARFVQMSANPGNQPPRGSIDAPSGDVTITAGSSVTFAGSATDPDGSVSAYRWIIPGGTPTSSTSQNPGSVQFSTPGSYHVSLTVTDNQGATDPSPPMRVVTVTSGTIAATITNPADGATVSGTVSVGMNASGVSGTANTFTLTLDGTQIYSTITSGTTASFSWNTTLTGDGAHNLGLTVRDATGAIASAVRTVTVNNNAPGTLNVSFPNLTPGQTVQSTVPVQIAVSGASGGSNRFTVFVDNVQQTTIVGNATTVTWNWDTTTVANGSHTISAQAQDATGNSGSGFVYVQVQNAGGGGGGGGGGTLIVSMTQPAPGATVSGTVWATIWVDNAAAGAKTYTLTAAGQTVASTSDASNGPISLPWITTNSPNGATTLTATVTDGTGASGFRSIPVTVQNAGGGGGGGGGSAAVTLAYNGKLRDRVGTNSTALSPDGTPDGTLTMTLSATGGRTVTGLSLSSSAGGGAWDTIASTGQWIIGVATSLDGPLLNNTSTMAVSVPVADGGSLMLFASDNAGRHFVAGATLTLTVSFSDGTSAQAVTTVPGSGPAPLTAGFAAPANGATVSGTISVSMTASGGTAPYTYTLTIDGAQVSSGAGSTFNWNTTTAANGGHTLALTVSDSAGGTAPASIGVTVQNTGGGGGGGGGTLVVSMTQPAPGATVSGTVWATIWVQGAASGAKTYTLTAAGQTVASTSDASSGPVSLPWITTSSPNGATTLTATVSDGAGNSGFRSIPVTVQNAGGGGGGGGPATVTIAYNGKLRDRVGMSSTALGPDGTADGTLTMTLSATGGRTVTGVALTSSAGGGAWDTIASTGQWVIGVATSLDGALLNNTSTMAVSVPVADGGSLVLFASDNSNLHFVGGATLTLTVNFSDGTSAQAVTTATGGGPGPLTAGFTAPANGATVSGTVAVSMTASGGTAPYTYTLTIDGTQVASGGAASFSWNTTGYADGSHILGLTVRDSTGATATDSRSVIVQNSTGGGGTLTVGVTAPSPGQTVSGVVWFTVWVDNAAAGSKTYTIVADGSSVFTGTSSDRPASIPWVTTNGTNGTKTVVVNVRDSAGATGSSPAMALTVNNP
jgi:galactose oxidase-like protein/glyoxal oxidase-like protein/PKD domain-containing protein/Big-like domain-containing protein